MCYITLDSYFLLFMFHIILLNRCVIINHANICLDLNCFQKKNILHVKVSKKIRRNFRGGQNFCSTEYKKPCLRRPLQLSLHARDDYVFFHLCLTRGVEVPQQMPSPRLGVLDYRLPTGHQCSDIACTGRCWLPTCPTAL